jgi:hypothetical protein
VSTEKWLPTCRRSVLTPSSGNSSPRTLIQSSIPEDLNLHQPRCENLKSRIIIPHFISLLGERYNRVSSNCSCSRLALQAQVCPLLCKPSINHFNNTSSSISQLQSAHIPRNSYLAVSFNILKPRITVLNNVEP